MCVSPSFMSKSLWPQGLQPFRPLCPWDSPGKKTGVGCHFLLQSMPCGIWLPKGQAIYEISSVQSLTHVRLFATPWIAARQASLSITNSRSPPKPMSTESVMPSNYLILCRPLLLLSSIFPSIRVFSSESILHIRWPKYCSFSFSISPSKNTQDWSPLGWTGWISLQSKGLSRVFSNTVVGVQKQLWSSIVQKHQFFCTQHFL